MLVLVVSDHIFGMGKKLMTTEAQWKKALSWYVMYHFGVGEPKYIKELTARLVPEAVAKRDLQRAKDKERWDAWTARFRASHPKESE